jgi:hypothetical protein
MPLGMTHRHATGHATGHDTWAGHMGMTHRQSTWAKHGSSMVQAWAKHGLEWATIPMPKGLANEHEPSSGQVGKWGWWTSSRGPSRRRLMQVGLALSNTHSLICKGWTRRQGTRGSLSLTLSHVCSEGNLAKL